MQTAQFKHCDDCGGLPQLYKKLECSIYQMIKNKWQATIYNVDLYFNDDVYTTLLRLKKIVEHRLYNPTYPSNCFDTGNIIGKINRILYKADECPECKCDNYIVDEGCKCYTVVGSSTPQTLSYRDCAGTPVTINVATSNITFCAKEGSVSTTAFIINSGNCTPDCTSTTTTILP